MDGREDGARGSRTPSADALFVAQMLNEVRELETLLVAGGATGRGLHEKVTSLAGRLPEYTQRQLRFIATVRNKLVHEGGFSLAERDQQRFMTAITDAREALEQVPPMPAVTWAQQDGEQRPATMTTPARDGAQRSATVTAPQRAAMHRPAARVEPRPVHHPPASTGLGGVATLLIAALAFVLLGGAAVPAWRWTLGTLSTILSAADAASSRGPARP